MTTIAETVTARKQAAAAAYSEAKAAGDGAAAETAWRELAAAEEELAAAVREAVDRGIDKGRTPLETLGREALQRFVSTVLIDIHEECRRTVELEGGDLTLVFAESLADYYAESALFPNLVAAYFLELDATNGNLPLPDGIVGRAVGQAVEALMPYATSSGMGWYNDEVAPKL